MTWTARLYADEADYALLRDFLRATWALSGPPAYCTLGDLDWWRYGDDDPQVMARVRLWQRADGAMAGFSWLNPGDVTLVSHPRERAVEALMLADVEERTRAADVDELTVWARTGDAPRVELLERGGYARTARGYVNHARELADPLPPPDVPAGYSLRHVRGEEDVAARVAVHRDAFAPSRMTVAKHRAVMAAPTYRPELDLVAVAPDGSFAAYCLVWLDDANRHGVFEPVGCAAAHRRRGLASAVMREGLRRLRAHGATGATVMSAIGSEPAFRLYQSLGFRELDRDLAWVKRLENADDRDRQRPPS